MCDWRKPNMTTPNYDEPMAAILERELTNQYGPMMTGESLRIALGYPSKEAFRQAFVRKTTPIPVFAIERRRGKFALTKDVAAWLVTQRDRAIAELLVPPEKGEKS
jgi:hypothetical protein